MRDLGILALISDQQTSTQVLYVILGEVELGFFFFLVLLPLFLLFCLHQSKIIMRVLAIRNFLSQTKQRVLLTGIQPTGDLHIGNYLGSVTNMLKFQEDPNYSEKYLMIADYHSLTTATTYQHSKISFNLNIGRDTLQMAKVLLASGVDPYKMCLFVQSQVPVHCQLTWILSCLGPQHWLNTMIQYKQKSHQNSSVGLYSYPILMAVDILVYRATHVPVGVDQLQHIQLTNKFAERFNKQFKTNFFPKVKYVESKYPKIMSLVNPEKKMSKSDTNQRSRITLSDSAQLIHEKIRRAVTDSDGSHISFDPFKRPGLSNLLQIYSAFQNKDINQVCQELNENNSDIPFFKEKLCSTVSKRLQEIQNGMALLTDDDVAKILQQGALKARKVSEQHLREVKQILHLYI